MTVQSIKSHAKITYVNMQRRIQIRKMITMSGHRMNKWKVLNVVIEDRILKYIYRRKLYECL